MFDEIDLSHKFRKLKKEIKKLKEENEKDKKTIDLITTDNTIKDFEITTLKQRIDDLKLSNVKAIEDVKKETDKLMMDKITYYENKIGKLKKK
tara:strand:- start:110 stop:388 length:279 start_codon:yes stop_codon:yes gene_type:complete